MFLKVKLWWETEPISSNLISQEVGFVGGHMISLSQPELQGMVIFLETKGSNL